MFTPSIVKQFSRKPRKRSSWESLLPWHVVRESDGKVIERFSSEQTAKTYIDLYRGWFHLRVERVVG